MSGGLAAPKRPNAVAASSEPQLGKPLTARDNRRVHLKATVWSSCYNGPICCFSVPALLIARRLEARSRGRRAEAGPVSADTILAS